MSENATPRTDAAEWIGIFTSRTRNISLAQQQAALRTLPLTQGTVGATAHVVYSQFSRNLERELSAANARIAELEKEKLKYGYLQAVRGRNAGTFGAINMLRALEETERNHNWHQRAEAHKYGADQLELTLSERGFSVDKVEPWAKITEDYDALYAAISAKETP